MISCQALVLLAAVAAGGDTTVVQFTSQSCPACKAVEPVVQRLQSEGYVIQTIDVDQRPDLTQQYQVRAVPTFVAVEANRETDRVIGATSYDRLVQMFRAPAVAPQSPTSPPAVAQQPLAPTDYRQPAATQPPQQTPSQPATSAASANLSPMQRALYASVRLKVEDSTGFGYGTGTIIDRHDDEALVVTCGHIFRQSQGKGKISADLFAPGATSPVAGQLIAFDLDRDIALVSIRPGVAIEPVTVAGPSFSIKPHDGAFSIGCDKGAEPSIRETRITAVNKYKGAPNITAAGQPVDGRSGGGLFTTDGLLIGICNAADPADDEGLYAALASIHWQLDQIGQSEIYRRGETAGLAASASPASTESPLAAREPSVPNLPARMPGLPSANATPTNSIPTSLTSATNPAPAQTAGNDVEVIMILRSKSNPQRQSEVIVLDNASPALIQQIAAQGRPATTAQPATLPSRLPENPIVRAQSAD